MCHQGWSEHCRPLAEQQLALTRNLVHLLNCWLLLLLTQVSSQWGLSRSFLGFIVLPIAGNACEHITAVFVAAKDKMDLSLGVAIGSSIQVGWHIHTGSMLLSMSQEQQMWWSLLARWFT